MKYSLSIIYREKVAEDTFEIRFGLKEDEIFDFRAGQHIDVAIDKLLHGDSRGSVRTFSLLSSPQNKEFIAIAFRDSGSGFKKTLLEMDLETPVAIEGPFGNFTLSREPKKDLIFMAGGIGITPFMSMVRFAGESGFPVNIILVYTNKFPERAAYLSELKEIERNNPSFKLIDIYERLRPETIQSEIPDFKNRNYYLAGPPLMVSDLRQVLADLGISEDDIYTEEFTGYK